MISLNYPSQSPRWPTGLFFSDWDTYSFVLGYLCNINHYYRDADGNISMQIEPNDLNGAYEKEGRILFYGELDWLRLHLPDLYNARSAGTGNVTARINCNAYVYSLIYDYSFTTRRRGSNIIVDVLPPASTRHIFSVCPSVVRKEFTRGFNL